MKQELLAPGEGGTKSYAIVIPDQKDADWWALDQVSRGALMQEHTQAALPYRATVKRKLYHSSGLDDFDFITYFETDKLEDFQSLIRSLEQVKEYRHDRRFGHPTLLGKRSGRWMTSGVVRAVVGGGAEMAGEPTGTMIYEG